MTELFYQSILSLSAKLASKKISSVELTNAYLDRIEKHNESINAFITVEKESALKSAEEADKKIAGGESGNLLGIPIGIKDLISTKGMRTTCASKILENFFPIYSATVIEKLKNAGAVITGKLNMDEFAMGSSNETSYFGPCKNPWDLNAIPGGSSGGSAAAVSAGLSAGTLGSDTGGSIRQPASCCGVVGLKPTYGRVSRFGLIAFASSLDQIGPLTHTVEDSAIMLQAIAGYDKQDSTSVDIEVPDYSKSIGQSVKGIKIGLPKEYFIDGVEAEVLDAVNNASEKLKSAGAEIIEISLPHTEYAVPVYYVIAPAEASSNLERYDGVRYGHRSEPAGNLGEMYLKTRTQGFGDEVRRRIMLGTYALSAGYYDAYYRKAQKVRTLIKNDFAEAFKKCDVIITPTMPTPAFNIGEKSSDPLQMYLSDIFTISANLAGIPGLSVPGGFSSNGRPIGVQMLANHFDEPTLFKVASAFEKNRNKEVGTKRPSI